MQTKIIEIRDEATYIPAIATLLHGDSEVERYHLRRAGLDQPGSYAIHLAMLTSGEGHMDLYHWGSSTMREAHQELEKNWYNYKSGEVLDVRSVRNPHILPAQSERFT